jgi:hypothetical protein
MIVTAEHLSTISDYMENGIQMSIRLTIKFGLVKVDEMATTLSGCIAVTIPNNMNFIQAETTKTPPKVEDFHPKENEEKETVIEKTIHPATGNELSTLVKRDVFAAIENTTH